MRLEFWVDVASALIYVDFCRQLTPASATFGASIILSICRTGNQMAAQRKGRVEDLTFSCTRTYGLIDSEKPAAESYRNRIAFNIIITVAPSSIDKNRLVVIGSLQHRDSVPSLRYHQTQRWSEGPRYWIVYTLSQR
jgi:hypothetical protein